MFFLMDSCVQSRAPGYRFWKTPEDNDSTRFQRYRPSPYPHFRNRKFFRLDNLSTPSHPQLPDAVQKQHRIKPWMVVMEFGLLVPSCKGDVYSKHSDSALGIQPA
jgi:hypothetical protein